MSLHLARMGNLRRTATDTWTVPDLRRRDG